MRKFLSCMLIAGLTMPAMTSLMAQTRDIPSILGVYTGVLQVSSNDLGISETFYDITMELKESAPNYAIKSEEIDLGDGIYVPEFELDDVNITESGNGYQLTRIGALTVHIDEIEVPGLGTITDIDVDITLENGYVEDNVLTLNLQASTVIWDFFPITIYIDFEGGLPTSFDCDPVTNLTAVYTEECAAVLTWEAPSGNIFNIFRDDILIKDNYDQTSYTDSGFNPDEAHTWTVTVVCDGGGESAPTYVTLSDGCTPPVPCNPATYLTVEITTGPCSALLTWNAAPDMPDAKYNVYRNDQDTPIATNVEGTQYVDDDIEAYVEYIWTVKTVCAEGESYGTDAVGICEEEQNIHEPINTITIYPNPSNTSVTITADNFAKVEIYNTVGQLVETKTDNVVDVSSYNTGIYLFKVYDANGNSVAKRVMVTK